MGRRRGFWGWYWRALATYRGYKIITREVAAAREREIAREVAAMAAKVAREHGLTMAEAEAVAEAEGRKAVAEYRRARRPEAKAARAAVAAEYAKPKAIVAKPKAIVERPIEFPGRAEYKPPEIRKLAAYGAAA